MIVVRALLITCLAACLWLLSGCNTRFSETGAPAAAEPSPRSAAPTRTAGAAPTAGPAAPKVRVLPELRSEPLIRVFLRQASALEFTLNAPARLPDGRAVAAGTHRLQASGAILVLDGVPVPAECPLEMAPADRRFSAELDPPFGKRQRLEFSGLPILRLQGAQAQLLEEVPMETYLLGVVPVEMTPSWPVEALRAQAIAARSYASAKYLERFDRPWQLHWHFTVDMAYGGVGAKRTASVVQALESTRGELLTYRSLPLPALFHACSGGATESATNLWPELMGGDRKTPMAAQMPVVPDADAEAGCLALGMAKSHWRWKANIPLAEITSGLQRWARSNPADKLVFGTVTGVEIASRHPDSGRVSQVAVIHKLDGRTRRTLMEAKDFRMAVDPGTCRSTWWDRCTVASAKGGVLVLAGRGFGHGAGLSQVSAWQLARSGSDAEAIVRRFYPTAALERRW